MRENNKHIVAEAKQFWDQMSKELRSRYPRDSVPYLINQYDHLTSSWIKYSMLFFSAINWVLGAAFAVAVTALLMMWPEDLITLAFLGSVLVLLVSGVFVWYRFTVRIHDEYEADLIVWDNSLDSILGKLSDFICLVKGEEVTTDSAEAQARRPMPPPWLSSEIANAQLRLLAIQARDVGASGTAGVYGQCLINLTAQVNRACELGVEPISRLGPAAGLGLLLEVAYSAPSTAP